MLSALKNSVLKSATLRCVSPFFSGLKKSIYIFDLGIAQASQSDFVIKEHTYTMCPGCPTFSIPVPIPVASLRQDQQDQQLLQSTFAEKDSQTSTPKYAIFVY
jgi:hypothetical protein